MRRVRPGVYDRGSGAAPGRPGCLDASASANPGSARATNCVPALPQQLAATGHAPPTYTASGAEPVSMHACRRLREIERELLAWHRSSDIARRLATIPGVGTICATAFAASVTDPHQFRSGRQFAAWLGLTPLQHSSGGQERLRRIPKMVDKYLSRLRDVRFTST